MDKLSTQGLSSRQAMIEMLNGGKITREHWSLDMYLEYVNSCCCLSITGSEYSFKNRPDYGWVRLEPKGIQVEWR